MLKYSLVIIMVLINLSTSTSQNLDLINTDYENIVYCHYANKYIINSSSRIITANEITSSVGEVKIIDAILEWRDIKNCYSEAYLIIDGKDSIAFTIKRKELPEPVIYPRMNCLNISNYHQMFRKIHLDSEEYKILDYDIIYQSTTQSNPFYFKNYGENLDSIIIRKIEKSSDESNLLIQNIRLYKIDNNSIETSTIRVSLSGKYYIYNKNENDLNTVIPLIDYAIFENARDKNSWIKYEENGDYIELKDNEGQIRAKYRRITPVEIEYHHYYRDRLLNSGIYRLERKSYFVIKFNPENYEEEIEYTEEFSKEGVWKEFDEEGKIICERNYRDNKLISEMFIK